MGGHVDWPFSADDGRMLYAVRLRRDGAPSTRSTSTSDRRSRGRPYSPPEIAVERTPATLVDAPWLAGAGDGLLLVCRHMASVNPDVFQAWLHDDTVPYDDVWITLIN
ncbi:hypothetical protein ABZP36_021905 [Zizania latifolia]